MEHSELFATLRNAARGGAQYRAIRHKISKILLQRPGEMPANIGAFLTRALFKIPQKNWFALSFDREDWGVLSAFRAKRNSHLDAHYLYLLVHYIASNAERVTSLYNRNAAISSFVLEDDGAGVTSVLSKFDLLDHQSLLAIRTVCAQHSRSSDDLAKNIGQTLKTDWLRKRFLYPLVYHALNAPTDAFLDTFLSYVTTGNEDGAERATIRFLLRDDICLDEPLSFKAYVGLLCHPYDACEIFLNHVEGELARGALIDPLVVEALDAIAAVIPSARALAMNELLTGVMPAILSTPAGTALQSRFLFSPKICQFAQEFCRTSLGENSTIDGLPKPLAALARMRGSAYPIPDDFDYLTSSFRKWRFTEAGRLGNAFLTALYMVPRTSRIYEARDFFRMVMFLGEVNPFIATSPSADLALSSSLLAGEAARIEELCDQNIRPSAEYADRMWIKAVHWSLREPRRRGQVTKWTHAVRANIRIRPSFLTGIDWAWIDSVLLQSRLAPFSGNPAGVYVLLLMKIEELDRDTTALRTAMEPLIRGMNLTALVEWLKVEFGEEATAFVRYFLTPEVILLLRLAPNETAAIAGRVSALESCVRTFRFTDLLSLTLYEQEAKTLTTALLLLNINSGQFEIPWGIFRRDVVATQSDLYETISSLASHRNAVSLLTTGRVTTPHQYRNGKVVSYTLPNISWPIGQLVISIIEEFLQHPSFGLEVLLSTRFRHDTLKREIINVTDQIGELLIAGVPSVTQLELIKKLSATLSVDVDAWLDRRLHTKRPARPSGLFDVIPDNDDLTQIVKTLTSLQRFDEMIDAVIEWIRRRLDEQLLCAREIFQTEFACIVQESIAKQRDAVSVGYRVSDVQRVASALDNALSRRINELVEWFKGSVGEERPPLTFSELKKAADGLFETAISKREFFAVLASCSSADRRISPSKVRLCFDVISELYSNAWKHSGPATTRIRIRPFVSGQLVGFVFSNLTVFSEEESEVRILGEQYTSSTDAIFREGNSGLAKIAALAATLIEKKAELVAYRRARSFHVVVPIWSSSENIP